MVDRDSVSELGGMSDEQLVGVYHGGRSDAMRELIGRYQTELFYFLIRFLGNRAAAEDVFQEAFVQVHISADTFDVSRRFRPWLFTIAANKARDYLRKQARRPTVRLSASVGRDDDGESFVDLMAGDVPMPNEKIEAEELRELVMRTIEGMPGHLREILLLSYFQRFSYGEIAEMLEIPLGTVKSRLHTAVGTFAKHWKSQNPGESES